MTFIKLIKIIKHYFSSIYNLKINKYKNCALHKEQHLNKSISINKSICIYNVYALIVYKMYIYI